MSNPDDTTKTVLDDGLPSQAPPPNTDPTIPVIPEGNTALGRVELPQPGASEPETGEGAAPETVPEASPLDQSGTAREPTDRTEF